MSAVLSTRCWRNSARFDCRSGYNSLQQPFQHKQHCCHISTYFQFLSEWLAFIPGRARFINRKLLMTTGADRSDIQWVSRYNTGPQFKYSMFLSLTLNKIMLQHHFLHLLDWWQFYCVGDGGCGHWLLVRMEWRPSRWSVCLPLLIFRCIIKSRSSLLAPAQPGGSRKRAVKQLWWCVAQWMNVFCTALYKDSSYHTTMRSCNTDKITIFHYYTTQHNKVKTVVHSIWHAGKTNTKAK